MLNENAQAWVEALRSGDYKQGRKNLHTIKYGKSLFCSLGVACDLFTKSHPKVSEWKQNPSHAFAQLFVINSRIQKTQLPPEVCEWLGLTKFSYKLLFEEETSFMNNSLVETLILMNDYYGATFHTIADIIHGYEKKMFNA